MVEDICELAAARKNGVPQTAEYEPTGALAPCAREIFRPFVVKTLRF